MFSTTGIMKKVIRFVSVTSHDKREEALITFSSILISNAVKLWHYFILFSLENIACHAIGKRENNQQSSFYRLHLLFNFCSTCYLLKLLVNESSMAKNEINLDVTYLFVCVFVLLFPQYFTYEGRQFPCHFFSRKNPVLDTCPIRQVASFLNLNYRWIVPISICMKILPHLFTFCFFHKTQNKLKIP